MPYRLHDERAVEVAVETLAGGLGGEEAAVASGSLEETLRVIPFGEWAAQTGSFEQRTPRSQVARRWTRTLLPCSKGFRFAVPAQANGKSRLRAVYSTE